MSEPHLNLCVFVAFALFGIGLAGVLIRRDVLVVLLSLELMFTASALLFVAFSRYTHSLDGQVFALFVLATSAAKVALALMIVVRLVRHFGTRDVDSLSSVAREDYSR